MEFYQSCIFVISPFYIVYLFMQLPNNPVESANLKNETIITRTHTALVGLKIHDTIRSKGE